MTRRFFRHGELPLALLALVGQQPMHAYELMTELGRRLSPLYVPSPGSIYPAVDALEAEGLIEADNDGSRTRYRITPVGQAALEKRRETLAALELRTGVRLKEQNGVDAALDRFTARVHALAARVEPGDVEAAVDEAVTWMESRINGTRAKHGGGKE